MIDIIRISVIWRYEFKVIVINAKLFIPDELQKHTKQCIVKKESYINLSISTFLPLGILKSHNLDYHLLPPPHAFSLCKKSEFIISAFILLISEFTNEYMNEFMNILINYHFILNAKNIQYPIIKVFPRLFILLLLLF